eukprot:CAMPEP_0181038058 /NCGR_PEP_ID=MMETSP1070-20121207/9734_1 /TAXON_ID=265543 /ORGANISM="Minutocellus polymorphus, Strain NH13" /LENGTH=265 /DNA_ID=CAMNT_0023115819 /DNA_START=74 /DNA_END=871 /DNA_ORIENTATION=+
MKLILALLALACAPGSAVAKGGPSKKTIKEVGNYTLAFYKDPKVEFWAGTEADEPRRRRDRNTFIHDLNRKAFSFDDLKECDIDGDDCQKIEFSELEWEEGDAQLFEVVLASRGVEAVFQSGIIYRTTGTPGVHNFAEIDLYAYIADDNTVRIGALFTGLQDNFDNSKYTLHLKRSHNLDLMFQGKGTATVGSSDQYLDDESRENSIKLSWESRGGKQIQNHNLAVGSASTQNNVNYGAVGSGKVGKVGKVGKAGKAGKRARRRL